MALQVSLAGQPLGVWDVEKLSLKDAFAIKAATGLSPFQVAIGCGEGDPASWQAVVWWLRRQKEPGLALEAVDFMLGDFDVDPVEEPEEVPTQAEDDHLSTSAPDETTSSTSSPAG